MAVTNKECNNSCDLQFTKSRIIVFDSEILETRVYTLELYYDVDGKRITEHIKIDMTYYDVVDKEYLNGQYGEYYLDDLQTQLVQETLKDYYVILENRLKDKVKFYLKNQVEIEPRWNF